MKLLQLNAEISILKSRINPHFLFNTLNNIYALAITENEKTPEAILKLAAIMRYTMEAATADRVPLTKEIDYLQNYISLQQLRSNNKLTVQFKITGNAQQNTIAPLLLINFIENAFKYGVSNHASCYVHIELAILDKSIRLEVSNKIIDRIVTETTFTGTNNTIKRLALQYQNKYSLNIMDCNQLYKVILQIYLA